MFEDEQGLIKYRRQVRVRYHVIWSLKGSKRRAVFRQACAPVDVDLSRVRAELRKGRTEARPGSGTRGGI